MGHKHDGSLCGVGFLTTVGNASQELFGVVANPILRGHGPKVDHIGIVPIEYQPCLWQVTGKKSFGPWLLCPTGSPRLLATARQSVDEDDAVNMS
jgi:hypothetical protein